MNFLIPKSKGKLIENIHFGRVSESNERVSLQPYPQDFQRKWRHHRQSSTMLHIQDLLIDFRQ